MDKTGTLNLRTAPQCPWQHFSFVLQTVSMRHALPVVMSSVEQEPKIQII